MSTPLQQQIELLSQDESEEVVKEQSEEEVAGSIARILTEIDKSERSTRDRMLRLWKYLELLWAGSGNYYWNSVTGQWAPITQEDIGGLANELDIDPTLLNKVVNLIRPYGESLAGVLTTSLPRVKYYPRNADNELDIQASKSYKDLESKIVDDNMMPLRLIEIIVKLWNGGFAAAYNYNHSDKKYGVTKEDVKVEKGFTQKSLICSNCGNETLGEEVPEDEVEEKDLTSATTEQAPDTDLSLEEQMEQENEPAPDSMNPRDVSGMEPEMPDMETAFCPVCEMELPHLSTDIEGSKPFVVDQVEIPKSRQIINIFGPMNVKIPSMAVRKEHIIWLILEEEIDIALARHLYPDHKDKIQAKTGSDIDIDRIARAGYEIAEDTLQRQVTLRKLWLTPAAFEIIEDNEKVNALKTQYPNGLMAVFAGDTFLEGEEQDLNDHWTVSINPLYPRIMADPLGKALIGLHETANDLFQLEVDTVRYAIPQTFVDPKVLDPKAYKQTRATPGGLTFAKSSTGGMKLADGFFETRTATIPKEVENLDIKVEKLLQFVSGILPSVFGGPASGSKTLGEYQESKNQALQRLSIIWKIVLVMYAEMMAKATRQYVKSLREDEFFVKEQGTGTYINVWLRLESFRGDIGEVKPEISEQFPMTWGQKSARIMELLSLNNQVILSWLFHPENVEMIYQTLGIDDLYIPGEEQRNKQLYEISQMIISEPIVGAVTDPMTGQPVEQMQSSVQPEEIDDDAVHMEVVKAFLNSTIGIDLKNTNPVAYQNIMLHYQAHMMRYQAMMQAQAAQEAANAQQTQDPNQVQ